VQKVVVEGGFVPVANDYKDLIMQETFMPAFTSSEMRAINNLVSQALISQTISNRLVNLRDITLVTEFDLPQSLWAKLSNIQADDLRTFCIRISQLQDRLFEQVAYVQSNIA
jgi:hypothetical protein